MVTLTIEGRRNLFGRVYGSSNDPRIELTSLGNAVRDEWWNIPSYHPEVKVFELQMMPDHLHGILYISEPLNCGLSGIIRGFKTGCGRHYRQLIAPLSVATESQRTPKGSHPKHGLLFEPGFNDLVLRDNSEYQRWKHYLRDNPRRLLMKRENAQWLRPFFQFNKGSYTFNGIGNRELLNVPKRLNVRITRRLSCEQMEAEVARYLEAARNGTVLISPAISPGEKMVMRHAFDQHLPIVVIRENGFEPLSKPHGEQFYACAKGLLLILSTWEHHNDRRKLTAYQCQQMNLIALELARGV